ncbi:hypothetical protein CH371_19780 [Leptospira wolffii]|uniref:Phage abortive infection protein n=1 Tax=Leptospira wolffii TaxID=409998 RepID=A0A2M9Z6V8_9LEPT|nr:putative phage abortive infection protein [Leptospira wolffii]PJZ64107.1 hypothetical protein CH371_19780 [Leptospira wolffii]
MKKETINKYLSLALIVTVVPFLIYFLKFNEWVGLVKDEEKWGQFGDYYGGILNPILTFLTFVLLVKTYFQQKEEAEIDRIYALKSNFDITFFNYLNQLNNLISAFERTTLDNSRGMEAEYVRIPGRDALYHALIGAIEEYKSSDLSDQIPLFKEGILKIYSKSLYSLLKLIDRNAILNLDEKNHYLEILKAQLVSSEIAYLKYAIRHMDEGLFTNLNNVAFFIDHFDHSKRYID